MNWPQLLILVCGWVNLSFCCGNVAQTQHHCNETLKRRQKRYLIFQKGSTFTAQVNIAKSILPGVPRGLNEITEFTAIYDVPTELQQFKLKRKSQRTTTPLPMTTTPAHPHLIYSPLYYAHDLMPHPYDSHQHRKLWKSKTLQHPKCVRWHFQQAYGNPKKICLRRGKRLVDPQTLATSQRIFYDIIDKWSLIHGYLTRYCFMRTLCEVPHLLLPRGFSLMHDIIRILFRFTVPWAMHHSAFGRTLTEGYRLDECATLYGAHCRISWLDHVSNLVHGPALKGVHPLNPKVEM